MSPMLRVHFALSNLSTSHPIMSMEYSSGLERKNMVTAYNGFQRYQLAFRVYQMGLQVKQEQMTDSKDLGSSSSNRIVSWYDHTSCVVLGVQSSSAEANLRFHLTYPLGGLPLPSQILFT